MGGRPGLNGLPRSELLRSIRAGADQNGKAKTRHGYDAAAAIGLGLLLLSRRRRSTGAPRA